MWRVQSLECTRICKHKSEVCCLAGVLGGLAEEACGCGCGVGVGVLGGLLVGAEVGEVGVVFRVGAGLWRGGHALGGVVGGEAELLGVAEAAGFLGLCGEELDAAGAVLAAWRRDAMLGL